MPRTIFEPPMTGKQRKKEIRRANKRRLAPYRQPGEKTGTRSKPVRIRLQCCFYCSRRVWWNPNTKPPQMVPLIEEDGNLVCGFHTAERRETAHERKRRSRGSVAGAAMLGITSALGGRPGVGSQRR
jgi:hypothetical protein